MEKGLDPAWSIAITLQKKETRGHRSDRLDCRFREPLGLVSDRSGPAGGRRDGAGLSDDRLGQPLFQRTPGGAGRGGGGTSNRNDLLHLTGSIMAPGPTRQMTQNTAHLRRQGGGER